MPTMCILGGNDEAVECCTDDDCIESEGGPVCTMNRCASVSGGSSSTLEFALTFVGPIDADLAIFTPLGARLSRTNTFDQVTLGLHSGDAIPTDASTYMESVVFAAPVPGSYTVQVGTKDPNVIFNNSWSIMGTVNNTVVFLSASGSGDIRQVFPVTPVLD